MSEEVKQEKAEETQPATGSKKKKINRLSLKELNDKIEDLEKKGLSQSNYFKHLNERKKELTPASAE